MTILTDLTATGNILEGDDWLTVLFKAEYAEVVDWCRAAFIQLRGENVPMPWDMLYNCYMKATIKIRGLDFSAFPMPAAPEVTGDDFTAWVEQHEADFGDMADAQFASQTGINMF